MMEHSAIELFGDAGDLLLLNFKDKRLRSRVRRWIKVKCNLEYRDRDRHRAGFRQLLHDLQESWQRRELSNFEYLMRLNESADLDLTPRPSQEQSPTPCTGEGGVLLRSAGSDPIR